jgi:succinate dehydrogenase / fumarate reductase iron-sulfur subunit
MRAVFDISRFNPQTDRAPRLQRYEVELPDGATVLEALIEVQDRHDGSLAFRRACRHGICGSCAVRINGCARLACSAQVSTMIEQAAAMAARRRGVSDDQVEVGSVPVRVEPLGNMPVIKDLVTDTEAFWRKVRRVRPWLDPADPQRDPERDAERPQKPVEWDKVAEAVLCLECGVCYSECPALSASPEFIGPTALAKAHRYTVDNRDVAAHSRLHELSGEHGLWECARCYLCSERCPKHIGVREAITELGELAYDEGLRSDPGAKHAGAFVDSLKESGRLNGARLPMKTNGIFWTLSHAATVVKIARAGKLPALHATPIERHDELKRVIARTEADEDEA